MEIKDTTRGYLDFAGLGKLRGQAVQDESAALREASQQFEAAFVEMMLRSMREAGFKSDLLGSSGEDMYQDMMDRELSVQLARRGSLGIADMLERQLTKREASVDPAASDVLRSRNAAFPVERVQPLPLTGIDSHSEAQATRLRPVQPSFAVK